MTNRLKLAMAAVLGGVLGCSSGAPIDLTSWSMSVDRATGVVADGRDHATITVKLVDMRGLPMAGQTVTLSATGDGSSLTQPMLTDGAGIATGTLASTKAGQKTVTARVGAAMTAISSTPTVTFVAGPPDGSKSTLTATPATVAADGVTTAVLQLHVVDAESNIVAGAPVTLTITGSDNHVEPATGTTDASGGFTATLASSTAEQKTITAAFGTATATTTVTFTIGAPSTKRSTLTAAPLMLLADGATSTSLSVTVKDSTGNLVSNQMVTLASTGSANSFAPASGITDARGLFSATLASTRAEMKTVTASFGAGIATADVTFLAGPPSPLTSALLANPATVTADGASTCALTVTIMDANKNPISNQAVTLAATGSANSYAPAMGMTDATGTFTSTLSSTRAEAKMVTAVFGGVTVSAPVTFVAGPAFAAQSTLAVNPATLTADGVATSALTLTVRDKNGNPVVNQAIDLSSTGSANVLAPAMGTTDAGGVFKATLSSTKAEVKMVTASFGGVSASAMVAFVAGPASGAQSSLAANPPRPIADGKATSALTLTVLDANANPVANSAVTIAATGTANVLMPAMGMTDGAGIFTAALSSTKAEAKTVTATFAGVMATATVTFVAGPPAAMQSSISAKPATVDADGKASTTLTVTARDANANPIANQAVTITASGSLNTLMGAAGMASPQGVFTATLASTKAEVKTVTAQLGMASLQTMVTFILPGSCGGTVQLPSVPEPAVGAFPNSLAAGDFDGDGKTDIAVANGGTNNVSVLLGLGNGVFQAAVNYPVGTSPASIIVADWNGDGKLDLATANGASSNVSVLVGKGDGTFKPALNTGTVSPAALTAADFDGDGKTDLALVAFTQGGNNVSTFLGKGDGTFQAKGNFAAGSFPDAVTTADFDGDGKADLATANFGSRNMSVFLGKGDGNFGAAVNYPTDTEPSSVMTGDLNGDGKIDVVTSNYGGNDVNVFLGNGDGTFSQTASDLAGLGPNSVAIGDFDRDGKSDVAVADFNGNAVDVLLGKGTGYFQAPVSYPTGIYPNQVITGDWNGDGKTDLATVNNASLNVSVLLGNGNGTFQVAPAYTAGSAPYTVVTADWNGDGKADLASANSGSNNLSILLGNGDGTFQAGSKVTMLSPYGLTAGDWNGDGKADLAASSANGFAGVFLGKGDGTFLAEVDYTTSGQSLPYSITTGDLNGDGKPDLVVANYFDNSDTVLLGKGDGTFQAAMNFAAGTHPYAVVTGDWNGDGKVDLATASNFSNNVSVLLGRGDGTFPAPVSYGAGTAPDGVTTGDFDGDGKADLAVTNMGSNNVSVLLGNGNGTFRAAVNYAAASKPYSVATADINGDGRTDLVIANQGSNSISLLFGNGNGTFQGALSYIAGPGSAGVTTGDWNKDGKTDVAAANFSSNSISVLLDTGCL